MPFFSAEENRIHGLSPLMPLRVHLDGTNTELQMLFVCFSSGLSMQHLSREVTDSFRLAHLVKAYICLKDLRLI